MEILIDKKRLENVALILSNYVEKKDNTNINSNILIIAQNNELILRASDSEFGIEYKIRTCKVINEGSILINSKKLIDILKSLNNDEIKIKKCEKNIKITQNKTNFSLPIIVEGNFVFLEDDTNKTQILISANELNKGLKMVNSSIDNNNISYQFNCCYIDILKDKISFIGSDSKRLNVYTINANNDFENRIIINKKSVIELMKLLNEEVIIYKNDTYLIIENDNFKFFTKLSVIDFLKYIEVMPHKEPNQIITIKNEDFLNEIKKLSSVCQYSRITFEKNKIIFKNNLLNSDYDETNVISELEMNLNLNESFEINISNKYMIDFLNLNDYETFDFKFYAESAPVIFESKNFLSLMSVNKG